MGLSPSISTCRVHERPRSAPSWTYIARASATACYFISIHRVIWITGEICARSAWYSSSIERRLRNERLPLWQRVFGSVAACSPSTRQAGSLFQAVFSKDRCNEGQQHLPLAFIWLAVRFFTYLAVSKYIHNNCEQLQGERERERERESTKCLMQS